MLSKVTLFFRYAIEGQKRRNELVIRLNSFQKIISVVPNECGYFHSFFVEILMNRNKLYCLIISNRLYICSTLTLTPPINAYKCMPQNWLLGADSRGVKVNTIMVFFLSN